MKGWRVGTLTLGVVLIGFGVLLILGQIGGASTIDLLYKWWPVVLIMFGVETLIFAYSSKDGDSRVRFDGVSIFLIILLVLFTITGYGIRFAMGSSSHTFNGFNVFRDYKYETKLTKHLTTPVNEAKKLILTNSMGRIEVTRGTGKDIEIDANITIQNNDEAYANTISDKAVEISKGSEIKISTARLRDNRIKNIYIDYVVRIPEGIEVELDNSFGDIIAKEILSNVNIRNSNGRIIAGAIGGKLTVKNSFGDIEINNAGGNVTVDNSNGGIFIKSPGGNVEASNSFGPIEVQAAAGNVKANGKNGRIYIENPAGDVYAHNSFGDIHLVNPDKSIDLESSNGSIRVETSKIIQEDVIIRNSFGGINLELPKTQGFKLKAETSFGDIEGNMDLNVVKETSNASKSSLDQVFGDGRITIDIKTSNGSIDINGK